MGGDGGSIPGRRDLVIEKRRHEVIERDILDYMNWKLCALSQRKLQEPIVGCELGRLYNREAILQYLIDRGGGTVTEETRETYEKALHIRGTKDVKTLKLTKNVAFSESKDEDEAYRDVNAAQFICPISGLEMNGKSRFTMNWNCGCVVADRAVKELFNDQTCCHCNKRCCPADLIQINGTSEEIETYRKLMEERRASARKRKESKKSEFDASKPSTSSNDPELKKAVAIKRPASKAEPGLARSLSKSKKPEAASIQNDPQASKVFKSLFTSSEKGKKQDRAHWVTYNPFYN